jgi:hypothetical protein
MVPSEAYQQSPTTEEEVWQCIIDAFAAINISLKTSV